MTATRGAPIAFSVGRAIPATRAPLADYTGRSVQPPAPQEPLPSSEPAGNRSIAAPPLRHEPRPSSEPRGPEQVSFLEAVDKDGLTVRIPVKAGDDSWVEQLRRVDAKHDALRSRPPKRK